MLKVQVRAAMLRPDVLWVGRSFGRIYKSTNATAATPTFVALSVPTGGMITRITIHPYDSEGDVRIGGRHAPLDQRSRPRTCVQPRLAYPGVAVSLGVVRLSRANRTFTSLEAQDRERGGCHVVQDRA